MESKSAVCEESSTEIMKWPTVIVFKELHTLIGTVKEIGPVTTMDEVLEGMKKYILDKQLFDPSNPIRVCCKDDQLGSILGVEEFTITQVKALLMKVVTPVPNLRNFSAEATSSFQSDYLNKRKFDESVESEQRKVFVADVSQHTSPMKLYIPPTPEYCFNESDTSDSIQGYETSIVKDTSDTSLSNEGTFNFEDVFDIEYEVESVSSDLKFSDSSCSSSDVNSDSEVMLNAAILTFLTKTDSDQEFFADGSSDDEDEEISEFDHWECNRCHSLNRPPMRYCSRCWEERLEWLPDKQSDRPSPPRRRKSRKQLEREIGVLSEDSFSLAEASVSQSDQDSLSQSSTGVSSQSSRMSSSQPPADSCLPDIPSDAKMCIICCAKTANASIIHGKYAHQVTCYKCARKLQKQKKRCPICRRTIDRVVHQIGS